MWLDSRVDVDRTGGKGVSEEKVATGSEVEMYIDEVFGVCVGKGCYIMRGIDTQ